MLFLNRGFLSGFTKMMIIVLVSFVVIPVLATVIFGWNIWRTPIRILSEEIAGRSLVIRGNLDVGFSTQPHWIITTKAGKVSFDNADWGVEKYLVEIDLIELGVDIGAIFGKPRALLHSISMIGGNLYLERRKDGLPNWALEENPETKDAANSEKDSPAFLPIKLLIQDTHLLFHQYGKSKNNLQVDLLTLNTEGSGGPVFLKGEGKANGTPFLLISSIDTQGKPINEANLIDVDANLSSEKSEFRGKGKIQFSPIDIDMSLEVSGPDVNAWSGLAMTQLPSSKPYKAQGRLFIKPEGNSLQEISALLGRSDFVGAIHLAASEKESTRIVLASDILDPDDLPVSNKKKVAMEESTSQHTENSRIFSNAPLPKMDFRGYRLILDYKAKKVVSSNQQLDDLALYLKIENGELFLQPLRVGFAGGDFVINSKISPNDQSALAVTGQIEIKALDLGKLIKDAGVVKLASAKGEVEKMARGHIYGQASINTVGASPHQLMNNLNGRLDFALVDGYIDSVLHELVSLDLGEAVLALLGKDEGSKVNCFIGSSEAKNGILHIENLFIATKDTDLIGKGTINLGDETLDLKIQSSVRDASIGASPTPILVDGQLKKPDVSVKASPIAARVLAGIGLGLINPAASILAFIEPGTGKKNSCSEHVARLHDKFKKNIPAN